MKKGFTLLELIIVIIIVGILASLGFVQYTKVVEKGRTAEAKAILGSIRTAQAAYHLENGSYATSLAALDVSAPEDCNQNTHYFCYGAGGSQGEAQRCVSGGKNPSDPTGTGYHITLDYTPGNWGSAGSIDCGKAGGGGGGGTTTPPGGTTTPTTQKPTLPPPGTPVVTTPTPTTTPTTTPKPPPGGTTPPPTTPTKPTPAPGKE